MNQNTVKVRLMQASDFDAIVAIDKKVLKTARTEYYEMKFEKLFKSPDDIPASLVAVKEDGTVVGFVMGEIFMGEYGIYHKEATLDTIGVDPDLQQKGLGKLLINEFTDHLEKLGVKKLNTLVSLDDSQMMRFFKSNKFDPSRTIYMERNLNAAV